MEKFNFLRFAKISCVVLGLSSLTFVSCSSEDPDDDGEEGRFSPDVELPGEVITGEEFTVVYPEGHTFGVWNTDTFRIPAGDHNDEFKTLFTMDKKSNQVRITYYTQIKPKTVTSSDVDAIYKVFKNDAYSEDAGFELMEDKTVKFAGCDGAKKLVAMEVEHQIYTERYIFYSKERKKVYSVVMQLPDTLRDSRYEELNGIVSSMKIK